MYPTSRRAALALAAALSVPAPARAFCGFYVSGASDTLANPATHVALMRDGTRTVLSMQNHYQGPPRDFAMVVPVPVVLQRENVRTLDDGVFTRLDRLTAPRLVEYWEQDPCATPALDDATALGTLGAVGFGAGRGSGGGLAQVRVEARFAVGEYQIVILSATDSGALDRWLRAERYNIPAGAAPLFEPYVRAGSKFFVARVDAARVRFEQGRARLSPLRVHYDSDAFTLPIRLGLINSPGTQDLVVHVLARNRRYDVANRANLTIPTNLDVTDATREVFGAFYNALFDRTVAGAPGAVVTEYAWATNTCDPCPTPPLDASDVATLGADVLPSSGASSGGATSVVRPERPTITGALPPEIVRRVTLRYLGALRACHALALRRNPTAQGRVTVRYMVSRAGVVTVAGVAGAPGTPADLTACVAGRARLLRFPPDAGGVSRVAQPLTFSLGPPAMAPGAFSDFVVTRLHTRYGRGDSAADLVFREAPAVMGGREVRSGPNGSLEQGATPSPVNNFQARYAIRHAWTGPVACATPRRGVWGGPPADRARPTTRAATDLAFAARAADLGRLLVRPLPPQPRP